VNYWGLFRESFGKMLHPTLWVFGLMAALGSGSSSRFDFRTTRPLADLPEGLRDLLGDRLASNAPAIIAAGIIISLVLLLFSTLGQAALLSLINRLENGERISVGMGMDEAGKRFLHLLAVRFLLALPLIIIGAAAAGSLLPAFSGVFAGAEPSDFSSFNLGELGVSLGRIFGLLGLALIVSLIVGGIGVGAERAVVIEQQPIFRSLGLGTSLLIKQIGDFIIIFLLFIVVTIAVSLLFACMLMPLSFAGLGGSLRSGGLTAAQPSTLMVIWTLVTGLLIGALTAIFNSSVWTLAYRQWRPQVVKRVARDEDQF
jgi:hypothetical protein